MHGAKFVSDNNARLEAVVSRLEDLSVFDGPILPSTLTDSNSEAIQAFDDFIDSSVKQYLLLSNRLGGLVAVQVCRAVELAEFYYLLVHLLIIAVNRRLPRFSRDFKNRENSCALPRKPQIRIQIRSRLCLDRPRTPSWR